MSRYTVIINLEKEDFDAAGIIRADRVLNIFQKAAEGQVDFLGVGPKDLIKKNLIWVLAKVQVKFLHNIIPDGEYICTTFPASQKRATFKRDYFINRASDGPDPSKALIIGTGQWCVIDYKTRKLARPDIDFKIPHDEIHIIEDVFPKIHANEPKLIYEHKINEQNLDLNDHCNNAAYVKMAEEATCKSIREELCVNFVSETRLRDIVRFYSEEQDGKTFVEGRSEEGDIVVQILFR